MTEKAKPSNTEVLATKATGNNTDAMVKKSLKPAETPQQTLEKVVKKAVASNATPKEVAKEVVAATLPELSKLQDPPRGPWDEPFPFTREPATLAKREPLDPEKQVTVNGTLIKPVATGLKPRGGHLSVEGRAVYLPYPNHRYEDLTFSAYYLGNHRQESTTLVLLDEFSTLSIDTNKQRHGFGRMTGRKPSSVVLVNSSSMNDNYYGESYLINVDSEGNTLNDSRLEAKGSVQGFSWEYGAWEESDNEYGSDRFDKFVTGQSLRHRYENCQFKRSTVTDSKLTEGFYSQANIYRSTIKGSNNCTIFKTEIKKSEIQGAEISIRNSNFKSVVVSCDGAVFINTQRLTRETIRTSSLYLLNKFCQMQITLPSYNDLQMIRISDKEFELVRSSARHNLKVPMNIHQFKLRDIVDKFLKSGDHDKNEAENPFVDSMHEYVLDSIQSRIKIVAMLDAAYHATRQLTQDSNEYDNPYGE